MPPPAKVVQNQCAGAFAWIATEDEADQAEQVAGLF